MCALNATCQYIKNWPEFGSLESKHVANCVLMTMYVLCLNEYVVYHTLYTTGWLL